MNDSSKFNNLNQPKDKKISNNGTSSKNQSNSDNSKIKNFGQWSSIAQSSNATNTSNLKPKDQFDTFQHFKRAAKEKTDRQKQIEEQQKQQNERLEKEKQEKMRLEKEKELSRKSNHLGAISAGGLTDDTSSPMGSISPASGSSSPSQSANDREIQRRREQERRRREAVCFDLFTSFKFSNLKLRNLLFFQIIQN